MTKQSIIVVSCLDCPWSWLAHEEILQLKDQSYQFEWTPFILKHDVPLEGEDFKSSAKLYHYDWTDQQIDDYVNGKQMIQGAKDLGFKWEKRYKRYNVITASIFAFYAKEKGQLENFITTAFRYYFLSKYPKNRNLADINVLEKIAEEVGLDKTVVHQVIHDEKYITLFQESLQKYPANGVPTFIYNNRMQSGFVPPAEFPRFIKSFVQQ